MTEDTKDLVCMAVFLPKEAVDKFDKIAKETYGRSRRQQLRNVVLEFLSNESK